MWYAEIPFGGNSSLILECKYGMAEIGEAYLMKDLTFSFGPFAGLP